MKFISFVSGIVVALSIACLRPVTPDHVSFVQDATVSVQSPNADGTVGLCAGVWISSNQVLTAAHCTESNELEVTDRVGGSSTAFVLAIDSPHDLSLVEVRDPPLMHPVARVATSVPAAGARLRIVGHMSGLLWTYAEGVAAGYRETNEIHSSNPDFSPTGPWLQVAAPFWMGDSGGGAFNERDELVGIASFKMEAPGFGFFVSNETIRDFVRGK